MKCVAGGTAAIAALMTCAPAAQAAVRIDDGPNVVQPDENVQFGVDLIPGDATLRGTTNQSNSTVLFVGGEPVVSPAQGQARVEALDSNGLNSLIFSLENGGLFTEAEFNILASVSGPVTISVFGTGGTLLQALAGSLNPWATSVSSSGQNFFGIVADGATPIQSVQITGGAGTQISSIGQFRLGGIVVPTTAVPEPALWATLLFGFGAIGFGLRRRKPEDRAARVLARGTA